MSFDVNARRTFRALVRFAHEQKRRTVEIGGTCECGHAMHQHARGGVGCCAYGEGTTSCPCGSYSFDAAVGLPLLFNQPGTVAVLVMPNGSLNPIRRHDDARFGGEPVFWCAGVVSTTIERLEQQVWEGWFGP